MPLTRKLSKANSEELEKEVYSFIQDKVIKQFIDLIILSALRNRPMSGYDLIVFIKNKYELKVSPGKVYQHLNIMARDGLLASILTPSKREYELTDLGRKIMEVMENPEGRLVKFLLTLLLEDFAWRHDQSNQSLQLDSSVKPRK